MARAKRSPYSVRPSRATRESRERVIVRMRERGRERERERKREKERENLTEKQKIEKASRADLTANL